MGWDGTDHERALETVYNRTINVDFQYIRAMRSLRHSKHMGTNMDIEAMRLKMKAHIATRATMAPHSLQYLKLTF